jgi:hypothetical protein
MAYLAGVLVGLWQVDAAPAGRLVVALLWPVGLMALAATAAILIVAAAILFPLLGAVVLGAALAGWALLR